MFSTIRKRDGRVVPFDQDKINNAIRKALIAAGEDGGLNGLPERLGRQAVMMAETRNGGRHHDEWIPEVEDFQDIIEEVLMRNGMVRAAKGFILYREQRKQAREANALAGATVEMFTRYLDDSDWMAKENANQLRSVNGLNNYVRETFTRRYWLKEVYPEVVRNAHIKGDGHIHDLGFLGPYCAGWDLRQLLINGFGGVPGKVESRPARHLRSFLGQIVNSTFTTQGECAGAQAWSSFDTFCAPFIRHDKLDYKQLRQSLQEFIFNLNVPTRVGFQCPFSNLTFDLTVPSTLQDQAVIIGGEYTDTTYGEYQEEMDLFNRAFCDAMMEGDAHGRVFTFPIPTINVTQNFNWDSPSVAAFMATSARYGIPYFANYVTSDLSPEDAVSMCCRLRLNTSELRKRGGGLFGSNPLTGSVGVYTINLPRIGFKAKDEEEFKLLLLEQMEVARMALEIKRKLIERQTDRGLYPYCAAFLREVKEHTGNYWHNHFSTIGIVGMHEAMLNFNCRGLEDEENRQMAVRVLTFMRDTMRHFQEETGHVYNLEATPAEGTSHRLAKLDLSRYPEIRTSGGEVPYYTNSTQLPVGHTDDIMTLLDHQDELQGLYTGGTVQHLYLGEAVEDPKALGELLKSLFSQYSIPYISFTPTFSVCGEHGYLKGAVAACPQCGRAPEVWSRVTGYLRPVSNFNPGKQQEFSERKMFVLGLDGVGMGSSAVEREVEVDLG